MLEWSSLNPQFIAIDFLSFDGTVRVRFYQGGSEIKRCGSGALAVAAFVDQEYGLRGALKLVTCCEQVRLQKSVGDSYAYGSRPLPQRLLNPAGLWAGLLHAAPLGGALCGGSEDYVILELESEQSIALLTPDFAAIKQHSKRAVIVTAEAGEKRSYVMRYFAPQYGNDEDAATGSANVQLMRYWFRRGFRGELKAVQLSDSGGAFSGCWANGVVKLCGRARVEQRNRP